MLERVTWKYKITEEELIVKFMNRKQFIVTALLAILASLFKTKAKAQTFVLEKWIDKFPTKQERISRLATAIYNSREKDSNIRLAYRQKLKEDYRQSEIRRKRYDRRIINNTLL